MLQVAGMRHLTFCPGLKRGEAGAPRKRPPPSQLVSPLRWGQVRPGSIFPREYFWQRFGRFVFIGLRKGFVRVAELQCVKKFQVKPNLSIVIAPLVHTLL